MKPSRLRIPARRVQDFAVAFVAVVLLTHYAATKPTNQLEGALGPVAMSVSPVLATPKGICFVGAAIPEGASVSAEDIARGYALVGVSTNHLFSYSCPTNGVVWESWSRRGAFRDWFTLDFPGGWTFPMGTNDLGRVTVFADARIRPDLRAASAEIAALGQPVSAVPGVSEFWSAATTNGSQVLTWRDFRYGRGAGESVSAQIELFPNGDFSIRSNAVERAYARIAPFDWDGDGLANDVDPEPYVNNGDHHGQTAAAKDSVLGEVGVGLDNGYYFLSATFPADPSVPTLVAVGTNRMVVVDAGEYLFLLEKGVEYDIHVEPGRDDVVYDAFDDVLAAQNPFGPMLRSIEWWGSGSGGQHFDGEAGTWTEATGFSDLWWPGLSFDGYVAWWPGFKGSPELDDIGPNDNCVFTGVFTDCHVDLSAGYRWENPSGRLPIVSPNAKTTEVLARPDDFDDAVLSVTATVGWREFQSFLGGTDILNTNQHVRAGIYVSAAPVVFRDGARRPLVVSAHTDDPDLLPLPTNGTVTLSFASGSSHVRLWSAEEGGVEVSLPRSWPTRDFDGFTCYMEALSASENVGDVEFLLSYSGEDGNKEDSATTTCAEAKWVHLQSSVAGSSSNPPPFDGQTNHEFNVRHSPNPDKHLPVFFEDVKGEGFEVNDFSVRLRLEIVPSGLSLSGVSARWEFLEPSPSSGSIIPVDALEADFVNPKVGGVYHIGATYAGSPMSECNIVLPLAGASIDSMVIRDLNRADDFINDIVDMLPLAERTRVRFGYRWFYAGGNGDYRGRPDSAINPTVWVYNQVADDSGLGAVATVYGVPSRISKLSNLIIAYTCEGLGVSHFRQYLAQVLGTFNDVTASESWACGVAIANGADRVSSISNLVYRMWINSDVKTRRLWPNTSPADNHYNAINGMNFNNHYYSPDFLLKRP